MNRLIDRMIDLILFIGKGTNGRVRIELKEFSGQLLRQVYNQIPGVSALVGLVAGGWIASTFTTSPITAALSSWGIIEGGRHVVSGSTFKMLSILIPLMSAGLAAYFVQKFLIRFRNLQMERNRAILEIAAPEIRDAVNEKLLILEKARIAGIVSEREYTAKKAGLYMTCTGVLPDEIRKLLINKLTG